MSKQSNAIMHIFMRNIRQIDDTRKSLWFRCSKYYVRYDKKTKEFRCDCKWWSIMGTDCSHIIASQILLNRGETINMEEE